MRFIHAEPEPSEQGAFGLGPWRAALARAASGFEPPVSVICPFGYELTPELRPRAPPRRLYPWLGVATRMSEEACDALAERFLDRVIAALHADAPDWAQTIVLTRWNRRHTRRLGSEAQAAAPDARSVNLLVRQGAPDVLADYALYVAAAAAHMDGALGEAERFHQDVRARRRLVQIYEMGRALAERAGFSRALADAPSQAALLRAYPSEFQDFYAGRWEAPSSQEETAFFERFTKPFAAAFRCALTAEGSASFYEVEDAYSGAVLRLFADPGVLEPMVRAIAELSAGSVAAAASSA